MSTNCIQYRRVGFWTNKLIKKLTPDNEVLLQKLSVPQKGHKIPRILWKVHYSVHNSSKTVPIQGQINPFYTLTAHLFKNNFNIIFLSMSS